MPFGLTNDLATFKILIKDILWKFLDKFLDDIIIFSMNIKEYK